MFLWDFEDLFAALKARDFDAARPLLETRGGPDGAIADDGDTFLHDAAQRGDTEAVAFLLEWACPRCLATFDDLGKTPLIHAAENGHAEVVAQLLAAGADPNANDESDIGNTAIREAVRGGYVDIVRTLLKAKADPRIPGWMQLTAVDQAWSEVRGGLDSPQAQAIQKLLAKYPSRVREGQGGGGKAKRRRKLRPARICNPLHRPFGKFSPVLFAARTKSRAL